MFKIDTLKEEMIGMIGWRQNPDPTGDKLLDLTSSSSGMYYNDEHAMLTLENLYSVAPDFEDFVYPDYAENTSYPKDTILNHNGVLYITLTIIQFDGGLGIQAPPITSETNFGLFNPFTQWLKEKTEAGIVQAVNDWYSKKTKFKTIKNLLSRQRVFKNVGDFDDLQTKTGKVVGQYIKPRNSKSVLMKISKISLQLSQNQTVTVKLFKKGTKTHIKTETLVYNANGGVQWFPIEWDLNGGELYFIGYDEDTLTGNAINSMIDDQTFFTVFPSGRYYEVKSFNVDSDLTEMWNESEVDYTISTNYGLNYEVTVGCDYTDFIVDQKDLFKMVIAKRVAILLLGELVSNANALVNRNESNVDQKQLLYQINGDSQSTPGNNKSLREQYDSALMDIQFDRSGIDRVCLPCKKEGINIGTI